MKKLIEKAKLEFKFRKAGEGHTLTEDKKDNIPSGSQSAVPAKRELPTASSQRAGEAALQRLSQQEKASSKKPQSATATWKHETASSSDSSTVRAGASSSLDYEKLKSEVKYEVEAEKKRLQELSQNASVPSQPREEEGPSKLSVDGIYFKCPICPMTFLRTEKDTHLRECLENLYTENPHMAAASIIQSLNKDKEKIQACIDILCKYIDNICNNPGEEKYRKIKQSNRIYKERVSTITGAIEFILACGFEDKEIEIEDKLEQFYVLPSDKGDDKETLETYKAILLSAEPIKPTIDRNLKVFRPSSSAMQFELPEDFFSLTSDEIKKEYHSKLENIDKQSQLRTKAMREADKKTTKTYRFTLIRVRFPDGIILQGTFYSREKLRDLFEFVRESLDSDWQPFVLSEPTGQLKAEESTLNELGLVPAAVVNFAWDASIMADIVAASGSIQQGDYLKSDLMALIQDFN